MTALRTATQQLRTIEAELAELRTRHAAVVEASEADSGGLVEPGLRQERERIEMAIREALTRVESARASIVREK